MKTQTVSVAPSSTHGHFVNKAKQVVSLDEINETFFVETNNQETTLDTANHTSLNIKESSLITCQTVYNPFSKMYEKSKD